MKIKLFLHKKTEAAHHINDKAIIATLKKKPIVCSHCNQYKKSLLFYPPHMHTSMLNIPTISLKL